MSGKVLSGQVLFNRLLARLRLRHLQLLVGVADAGNIQRAADKLGLSQPAATQAIAEIERVLDLPLFERHARGVRLTRYGAALMPVARSALRALQSTTDAMAKLRDGHEGVVRVGMIAAGLGLMQLVLPRYHHDHPGTLVEVLDSNVDHLLAQLQSGRLDLVLCRQPQALSSNLRYESLLVDDAAIVCNPRHALAARRSVALEDLRGLPWLVPPEGVGARPVFDALWKDHLAPALHPVTTTSIPLLMEMLRTAPEAVAIAPRSLLRPYCDWNVVRELRVELPEGLQLRLGHIGIVTPGSGSSQSAMQLCDTLRHAVRDGGIARHDEDRPTGTVPA